MLFSGKLLVVTQLADTRRFAASTTQIVQAGTTNMTAGDNLDLFYPWIMQGKGFFHTDTVGDLPDSVSGVHGSFFPSDHHTLEDLDTLFVSLYDTNMDLYVVSRTKGRMVLPHLLLLYFINDFAHNGFLG